MKAIDPKYAIDIRDNGHRDEPVIVKASTGEAIPDGEPLILFRARDELALPTLVEYLRMAVEENCTAFQIKGICNRICAFAEFREEQSGRMKQPGITRGL